MAFNDPANPIFDCGNKKPMRTRTFRAEENGKPITRTERRPQGKYLMVIDTYGNEVPLKLHNAISEQAQQDPYKIYIQYLKATPNAEWGTQPMIPSTVCPQQTEYEFRLPDHLRSGRRCGAAADGQPVGEDRLGNIHWCKCIKQLVHERREVNREIEEARDPKTTIMQAVLNNSQETTAQLTQLLKNMVDTGMIATEKPVSQKKVDK